MRSAVTVLIFALTVSGCIFREVREQQEMLDASCRIEGTVASGASRELPSLIVVLLVAEPAGGGALQLLPHIDDYFVVERAGRWAFVVGSGNYRIAAFEDLNADLAYQAGEPFVGRQTARPIACGAGSHIDDITLALPAQSAGRFDLELDVAALQARSVAMQGAGTLGELTTVGELTSLSDARFDRKTADNGLWRPLDFIVSSHPGVYFLEPYDRHKMPVLFVHGVNDSPAGFSDLVASLDRSRFQPWFYSYPSGVHMDVIADHLNQTMAKLQARYRVGQYAVVGHSMGGLVARGFILRHADSSLAAEIPLFISISTPWAGHKGAQLGVKYSPTVVDAWRDMAPGSDYLGSLFARPLPTATCHYLLFSFKRGSSSSGESNDGNVTVASQLAGDAQGQAVLVRGFDDTHEGMLHNTAVAHVVNEALAQEFATERPGGRNADGPLGYCRRTSDAISGVTSAGARGEGS